MFSILSLLSTALAVRFVVESSDSSLNGKGLVDKKINNGVLGLYFADSPNAYPVDDFEHTVYTYQSDAYGVFLLGERLNDLVFAYENVPTQAVVSDGFLSIPGLGNGVFYACDQLDGGNDAYGVTSSSNRAVSIYTSRERVPDTCTAIKIKAEN